MHTRGLGCEGEVTNCTQEGWGARVRLQKLALAQSRKYSNQRRHLQFS